MKIVLRYYTNFLPWFSFIPQSGSLIKEGSKAKQVANEPLNSTIRSGDSPLLPRHLPVEEPFYSNVFL